MFNKDLIYVYISFKRKKFATSNLILLDSYSTNLFRKIIIKKIQIIEKVTIEYKDTIELEIWSINKKKEKKHMYSFNMILEDFSEIEVGEDWTLLGSIQCKYDDIYKQSVIDIYNEWQLGREIDWFGLEVDSYKKYGYSTACLKWGGIPEKFLDKECCTIDFSKIEKEVDFYFVVGIELFGAREYCGHSLYSFEDVLFMLQEKSLLRQNKIKFIFNDHGSSLVHFEKSVVSIFSRHNFNIIN